MEPLMPFTTGQLAERMNHPQLDDWAGSSRESQRGFVIQFRNYFDGVQEWITDHGGANPFGEQNNVAGLIDVGGGAFVLQNLGLISAFNDAFHDVRTNLGRPTFILSHAARSIQRLIGVLAQMG
jgi:hypothetical protein